jgi:drug/metabolite transporter (DMT)-like permease
MPSAKFKNQLHLHLLVFIAGFTAILGELISLEATPLVWYRMVMASFLMYLFIVFKKIKLKVSKSDLIKFFTAGILIALHWITFFASIKAANISIALAMFSTGAFFASLIEPIFFKRKIIPYEIIFGLLVIVGVFIVVQTELRFLSGIVLGITSALFSTLFAVLNGTFVERHNATVISFYEFIGGVLCMSLFLTFSDHGFSSSFFEISLSDLFYLAILASVCTAYAFIASVHVMRHISPYSVVLTYNLEPIYGIVLAVLIFPESEVMDYPFYCGAALIIVTVLMNAILKHRTQNLAHNNTNKT